MPERLLSILFVCPSPNAPILDYVDSGMRTETGLGSGLGPKLVLILDLDLDLDWRLIWIRRRCFVCESEVATSAKAAKPSLSNIHSNSSSCPANFFTLYLSLPALTPASFVEAEDFKRSVVVGACSATEELPLPPFVW